MNVRRVYEAPHPDDGQRVLVDRLWPRGLSKERARVDVWLKEVAPSTGLRRWYHAGGSWDEFQERYLAELQANPDPVQTLERLRGQGPVTLLYGIKDAKRNHALLLREFLISVAR